MDLLDELSDDKTGSVDLLADLEDGDDTPAWIPKQPNEGVQGTVTSVGSVKSKYQDATGQFPDCPVVVLQQADGSKVRVTAYQSILRKEIQDADPQPGDLFAAKYFGKKDSKSGTSYHHYKVAVRRGQRTPATAAARPF